MPRFLLTTHRWLGLIVGLMLLVWCLSGFVFIVQKFFDTGVRMQRHAQGMTLRDFSSVQVTVPQVVAIAAEAFGEEAKVRQISLRRFFGRPVYEVQLRVSPHARQGKIVRMASKDHVAANDRSLKARTHFLIDGATGNLLPPVTQDQARQAAAAAFNGTAEIVETVLLQRSDGYYSTRNPVPVYRVTFGNDRRTSLYVSLTSGEVVASLNRTGRVVHWLGRKLHFLTFVPRDISTLLRGVFAMGGMGVAATGLYLFFARWKRTRIIG